MAAGEEAGKRARRDGMSSLWQATAVPAPATEPVVGKTDADVLIVGGGYTGLSTAFHLAGAGRSVVVVEAGDIGSGASGRNGGQVNPGFKLDPRDAISQLGAEAGERALAFAAGAPDLVFDLIERHGLRCDARRPGWLMPAHDAAAFEALKRRADDWSQRGVAMRILQKADAQAQLGTAAYHGAALDPRGGSIQPLSYARELARLAIGTGARVFTHSPVRTLSREGGKWVAQTGNGSVCAPAVVVATNGYTDDLVPRLRRTIIAANSFQLATAPLDETLARSILPGGHTASDSRRIVLYFRKDCDNRFVIGGRGQFDDPADPDDFAHLRKALVRLFPALKDVAVEHHWAGRVALTRDGIPHVHEPQPGMLVALGYNGRGVAMATAMGKAIAERLCNAEAMALPFPPSAIAPIPFHRFQRFYLGAAINWFMLRDAL